ncbi:uncharacterized protein LOC135469204 [Liolophura sinensis]|uniref:uncharacterized protein LOC135469204 n=1 Tax=Liolophura sinensis TaxID=3198878 RepID=UPI003158CC81
MATILGVDHKVFAVSTIAVSVGIAGYSVYRLVQDRKRQKQTNIYESQKLVSEYLVFHYGSPDEILRWSFGPKNCLEFPKQCADICMKYFKQGDSIPLRALDIGCAVGRSSFELARMFEKVIGIDYSQAFVDVCDQLKADGMKHYAVTDEGDLNTERIAVVPSIIDRGRTSFQQGDACDLPTSLGQFGCVLAANLICRLHKPFDFLARLPGLVAPGGILVITSPYTWLEQFTPKSTWLGGYRDEKGKPVTGFDTLKAQLSHAFDLVEEMNVPFFIRETARKNQWTVAHVTIWRRN